MTSCPPKSPLPKSMNIRTMVIMINITLHAPIINISFPTITYAVPLTRFLQTSLSVLFTLQSMSLLVPSSRFLTYSKRLFCATTKTSLVGKSALITGSTSGIGLSIASLLASKGCKVVLNGFGDVDNALLTVKSSSLDINFNDIFYIDADLSVKDDAINLVKESILITGDKNLDIVVNNAGIQHVSSIESFDNDKYLFMMNLMLNAPFFITQAVIPVMRKYGYGRIINISSAHGLTSSPNKAAYIMAKHGIIGLTKTCSLEMALENNINWTCNAICPGFVQTELAKKQVADRAIKSGKSYEEEEYKLLSEKHATGQWVQPNDIAEMVNFLCADHARQITGLSWSIDGGWTAR